MPETVVQRRVRRPEAQPPVHLRDDVAVLGAAPGQRRPHALNPWLGARRGHLTDWTTQQWVRRDRSPRRPARGGLARRRSIPAAVDPRIAEFYERCSSSRSHARTGRSSSYRHRAGSAGGLLLRPPRRVAGMGPDRGGDDRAHPRLRRRPGPWAAVRVRMWPTCAVGRGSSPPTSNPPGRTQHHVRQHPQAVSGNPRRRAGLLAAAVPASAAVSLARRSAARARHPSTPWWS